jgi:hypothetical protein
MRGSRPGERRGGRQAGVKNKRTVERERSQVQAAARITKALGPGAFEGDAHALLVSVYKDSSQPIGLRVDAAKAAIGYEKPRLSVGGGNADGGTSRSKAQTRSHAASCSASAASFSSPVLAASVRSIAARCRASSLSLSDEAEHEGGRARASDRGCEAAEALWRGSGPP